MKCACGMKIKMNTIVQGCQWTRAYCGRLEDVRDDCGTLEIDSHASSPLNSCFPKFIGEPLHDLVFVILDDRKRLEAQWQQQRAVMDNSDLQTLSRQTTSHICSLNTVQAVHFGSGTRIRDLEGISAPPINHWLIYDDWL